MRFRFQLIKKMLFRRIFFAPDEGQFHPVRRPYAALRKSRSVSRVTWVSALRRWRHWWTGIVGGRDLCDVACASGGFPGAPGR